MTASATPRIVLAYDGSPSARAAIARAGELVPAARAVVVSVSHGLDSLIDASRTARLALPDDVIREASGRLRADELAEAESVADEGRGLAAASGLEAEVQVVVSGEPVAQVLADVAREAGAGLIVCGTRGQSAAVRAVLGSVAAGLVRRAQVPVLVVPDEAQPAAGPALVGYDGSAPADAAVRAAGSVLAGREAVVLYAWRSQIRRTLTGFALRRAPAGDVRALVGDLDALFADEAAQLADRGVQLAGEVGLQATARTTESGAPVAQVLMDTADELDAAVIVAGPRGRGAVASALLGSVSSALLHASARPVLMSPHLD